MNLIEQNAGVEAGITQSLDEAWYEQAQKIKAKKYSSAVEKQFLTEVAKTLSTNLKTDTHDHPYHPIEYAVTRNIAVEALKEKYPAHYDAIQELVFDTVVKYGKKWQEQKPDTYVFGWLAISCLVHLSYRGMPEAEVDSPYFDMRFNTDLCSVPDIISFVEKAGKENYAPGINENHSFLAQRIDTYLKAADQTGCPLCPAPTMAILTRFAFGGEEVRPCFASAPTSEKIMHILLDHVIANVSPEERAGFFFAEQTPIHWKFFSCKSVYNKMISALPPLQAERIAGQPGEQAKEDKGRGPRD